MELIKLELIPGAQAVIDRYVQNGEKMPFNVTYAIDGPAISRTIVGSFVSFNLGYTKTYISALVTGLSGRSQIFFKAPTGEEIFRAILPTTPGVIDDRYSIERVFFYTDIVSEAWDISDTQYISPLASTSRVMANANNALVEVDKRLPRIPAGRYLRNDPNKAAMAASPRSIAPVLIRGDIFDDYQDFYAYRDGFNASDEPKLQLPAVAHENSWINYTTSDTSYPSLVSSDPHWTFDVSGTTFKHASNTTAQKQLRAIVSPTVLMEYMTDVVFTSTANTDGNAVFVLAAVNEHFDEEESLISSTPAPNSCAIHNLCLVRGLGADGELFSVVYNYGWGSDYSVKIAELKNGIAWGNGGFGDTAVESGHSSAPVDTKSWSANPNGVRLYVERLIDGNSRDKPIKFKIRTSQINSTSISDANLVLEVVIKRDDPLLGRFYDACHFGIGTSGQGAMQAQIKNFIDGDRIIGAAVTGSSAPDSGTLYDALDMSKIEQTSSDYNSLKFKWVHHFYMSYDDIRGALIHGEESKRLWLVSEGKTRGFKLLNKG